MEQGMRAVVAESWHRSAAAGVDVGAPVPSITVEQDDLVDLRAAHALPVVAAASDGPLPDCAAAP